MQKYKQSILEQTESLIALHIRLNTGVYRQIIVFWGFFLNDFIKKNIEFLF